MRREDIKRLEALEMWIWRRMERVSWMELRTKEEILQLVEEKIPERNNPKPAEKVVGPHNEGTTFLVVLPSQNDNRGKNGSEIDKRKTENDVISNLGWIRRRVRASWGERTGQRNERRYWTHELAR